MKLTITPAEGIDEGDEFTAVVSYHGTPVQITDADDSSRAGSRLATR